MMYIFLLCLIPSALSISVPFIKPCNLDDNACIVKSANDAIPYFVPGIPEIGTESIDPMHIDVIKAGQAGLDLNFYDNHITGLKSCVVTDMKSELLSKNKHAITLKCDKLVIVGQYQIDGNLLTLPIQGKGPFKIELLDMEIKVSTEFTQVNGDEGKLHWNIKKWRHSFKVLKGATFEFDNLFNGNKVLAEPVINFMNQSWKEVLPEAGQPIEEAIISRVVEVASKLYKYSTVDELYVI